MVWDASTFAKNRDRFLEMAAAAELLAGVVDHPDVRRQMSRDHFSVDGTLIDALQGLLALFPAGSGSKASWPSMGVDEELQA